MGGRRGIGKGKGFHPTPGRKESLLRLKVALVLLLVVFLGSTLLYMLVEGWGFLDSLYMVVLALSSVGFGEVHHLTPGGKVLTILVIVGGVGAAAYVLGTASQVLLEDRLRLLFGRKTMKALRDIRDHYILCGFGRMGRTIAAELSDRGIPFVVIENDPEGLEELDRLGLLFVRGDATNDETLQDAGIDRARGLVSVVTSDSANVYIVLSARGLNPRLAIVARAEGEESEKKLLRAGANRVVSPYSLGGFRIAQAVHSPTVLDFLERIIHDKTLGLGLDEVTVAPHSRLAGVTIADSGLRRDHGLIILAVKEAAAGMVFNPPPETVIRPGDTLVALGRLDHLGKLEKIAAG